MFIFLKNKETVLKEKIAFLQVENSSEKKLLNEFIQKVAILTTVSISNQFNLQELVDKKLNVQSAKIYSYRKFNKGDQPSNQYFSETDIAKNGNILNINFNDFLTQEFDLLITLLDVDNLYVDYATGISKANFKVGFANGISSFYDLEITGNTTDLDEFLSELKKYLIILNKLPTEENLTQKTNL